MGKKTKQDPTGQAINRNRANRKIDARLDRAERRIKAEFRSIDRTRRTQVKIVNQATPTTIYDYDIDEQGVSDLTRSIQFALDNELLQTQTDIMPPDWFLKDDIELSIRQGTVEEVRDFNAEVVAGAIAAGVTVAGMPPQPVEVQQVLLSEPYRRRLAGVQAENFRSIKELGEKTAAQAIQRISAGIQAGDTPTAIIEDITDRFSVARSGAKRTVRTEMAKAFNDAKLAATKVMSERTGLRAGVIHVSALIATTRAEHAARHGNAYTVDDQLQWWNSGANRINCLCTTISVFIDGKGNVVNKELQESLKAER